jgi:hypothetical protein
MADDVNQPGSLLGRRSVGRTRGPNLGLTHGRPEQPGRAMWSRQNLEFVRRGRHTGRVYYFVTGVGKEWPTYRLVRNVLEAGPPGQRSRNNAMPCSFKWSNARFTDRDFSPQPNPHQLNPQSQAAGLPGFRRSYAFSPGRLRDPANIPHGPADQATTTHITHPAFESERQCE